jgi:serine/threonine-protein kinase
MLEGTRRLVLGPVIGRGTLGVVRVAELQSVHGVRRRLAAKIFDTLFASDGDGSAAIARAVRHSAYVRHPNVVEIHELAVVGEHPYVLTELVEGCSLDAFASAYRRVGRRLPVDLALFVAVEIAEGLAGARSAKNAEGIVLNMSHHDLSPRQVLLSWNGEVKVSDFGLRAAGMSSSGIRPVTLSARATMTHIAPEVVQGSRGDARSDVFSLGVMLHEMLRGPRFAEGVSDAKIFDLARVGDLHRSVREPLLPEGLMMILERATAPDPKARYPHAGVLAYDLRRVALSMGVGDGRSFLRSALFEMTEGLLPEHDTASAHG